MRTYKDAKAMAKSLRKSLTARSVLLSHSECLEIIARLAGFADWNTLSAKLGAEAGQPSRLERRSDLQPVTLGGACQVPRNAGPEQPSCSFCGKSKVRSLCEGGCSRDRGAPQSCVFICDECVALCAQVNADLLANAASSERLALP
jgi:Glyoxalase superfamily protein